MRKFIRKQQKMTRHQFEQSLGGNFTSGALRTNGRFKTFKDFSKEVQERIDCFCTDVRTGKTISGRNWAQLADRLEADNVNG